MRQLMISLDKNILDSETLASKRMIEYGRDRELFIIIPSSCEKVKDLSDNVHVYSVRGNKFFQFFKLLKFGKSCIKNKQINEITVQDPFFIGLIGIILKNKFKLSLEVQVHGDFYGSNYYKKSGLKNWFSYYLGKYYILPRADKIRAAGQRIAKGLIKIGVDENKINIRPITINTDYIKNYQPKSNLHLGYSGYKKIFLYLGRIVPVKNISWLIDIFAEVNKKNSDFLLLIVGTRNGLEEDNLLKKVKKLKLVNNIKFENWVTDPISYIKTADCLLFPSLSEGYGLVAMEAAAAGTPIIMTDVGVANYELQSGPKVKIIPVGDRDKFIQAILQL
ncbi:MAG: glycosyltransferase family 4 protein [Candidatus Magasanikbacteria bacterium]|nr:glycosyltransferase family 4 protein [Candidatus Magasanikbacteria bacterium]